MKIIREGQEIELTSEEKMSIYSEMEMDIRRLEAKTAFESFVDAMFLKAYGFTHSGAIDSESEECVLEKLAEDFVLKKNPEVPEKTTWETVVKTFMDERRAERKGGNNGE